MKSRMAKETDLNTNNQNSLQSNEEKKKKIGKIKENAKRKSNGELEEEKNVIFKNKIKIR